MQWEDCIPDLFEDIETNAESFIQEVYTIRPEEIQNFFKVLFPTDDMKKPGKKHFEYFTNLRWRKFLLSAYYADLASYTQDADRVDFSRLSYIVNKFPEGFTVWWIQARNRLYPAGYTGWYYVEESLFKGLQDDSVTNRFFLPAPAGTDYIYLFNYSLAPALNHTVYSRILMQDYGSVISNAPYKGLFCVTVSADGIRIAERFGMRPVGAIKTPDGLDRIYMLCK